MDFSKHIIFVKNSEFLVNYILNQLYSKGLDKKSVFVRGDKESAQTFKEKVYTLPMFGTYSVGIQDFTGDYSNDAFEDYIGKIPQHAYMVFKFDRLPGRISQKIRNNVYFRDVLDDSENANILQNFLVLVGKKVSINARKFLLNQMKEDPQKVLVILEKLVSVTPHLWIDEQAIIASFDESLSAFEGPMAFWKSKGLEAVRILRKLDYPAFRTLYSRFLMTLIRFKLAEGKPIGEKMRIIKASPDTIRRYEDLVKPYTLNNLQARFLYYTAALTKSEDEFLIYHLTAKF